jgi:hypothetical protein
LAEQGVTRAGSEGATEPYGQASLAHSAGALPTHHGRPTSWATTVIIVIGFIVGGVALPVGPVWWLFWTGVGIVVIGGLFGAANRIFDDWY